MRRLYTSFKFASHDLCHVLADLAKQHCNFFVDPKGISLFLVCHLVAPKKCPRVRPIRICEPPKQIVAEGVLFVTKEDLQDAARPLQVCTGQIVGTEVAIHVMKSMFSSVDTEAILLVDTSNAFNSMPSVSLRQWQHAATNTTRRFVTLGHCGPQKHTSFLSNTSHHPHQYIELTTAKRCFVNRVFHHRIS